MKQIFLALILLLFPITVVAQSKIEKLRNEALKEGQLLYESEKASWHGTDLFLERFPDRSKIGGYVSYSENGKSICIFISKDEKDKVIGTMTFDKTFDLNQATVDLTERKLSTVENEYFDIRTKAMARIEKDTLFKYYQNTSYNIIPIIVGKQKKVYVITASTTNGVVLFGNDYLISFDKKDNVSKTERLHKSLISFNYGGQSEENRTIAPMHNHLEEFSDVITATDICTTMLYQKMAGWENSYVVSKKYVSIWDCQKNDLAIITMDAWQKMSDNTPE